MLSELRRNFAETIALFRLHRFDLPVFLALRQAAKKWTMPIHHWREALNHFTILWPQRMPALERVSQ
jgi:transposase-like protein